MPDSYRNQTLLEFSSLIAIDALHHIVNLDKFSVEVLPRMEIGHAVQLEDLNDTVKRRAYRSDSSAILRQFCGIRRLGPFLIALTKSSPWPLCEVC